MWVVQRYSEGAKAERSGAGGEQQCVVRGPEIEQRQNVVGLAAASASVCCAWARDRAKAERSGAGGKRQCVVRGPEIERRQNVVGLAAVSASVLCMGQR